MRERWYSYIDWAAVAMFTGSGLALLIIVFSIWSWF